MKSSSHNSRLCQVLSAAIEQKNWFGQNYGEAQEEKTFDVDMTLQSKNKKISFEQKKNFNEIGGNI